MLRPIVTAIIASAALLGATAAQAGTHWSVGINVPVAGLVVSNAGGYYAQEPTPVYYAPPVVRYAPDVVYEMPDRSWRGDDEFRWERRRAYERARWEHERHERHERYQHERERDDRDSHRWHRD